MELLSCPASFGQEKMTLEQCIQYAIENNLSIKNQQLNYRIAKENNNQAKRNLLPGISASSNAQYNYGRSIDENTNDYVNEKWFSNSYSASSSITLFNGFQKLNNIKAKEYIKEQVLQTQILKSDELAFDVMTAYFDVVYFIQMQEIANEQVKATELELKSMERKSELGLIAKTDLLEIKANMQNEELNLLQLQHKKVSSLMQLKKLLNYPQEGIISIDSLNSKNIIPKNSSYSESSFTDSFESTPAIQIAQSNINIYRKEWIMSKGALLPAVNGFAGIGTGFYETATDQNGKTLSFHTQFKDNLNEYVGLSISIPIWNKWNGQSNIKTAKLNYLSAQNDLEQEKQSLHYTIAEEIQNIEALQKEYAELLDQNDVNNQAFLVARKKLDKGLITIVDFYVAKNRLAQSKADILNTELKVRIKRNLLDYYKGIRFWE